MVYCAVSDVRRRTPSISALDVQDSTVNLYILEAQDLIDSYLQEIYSVPFNPVPIVIKQVCADIAAYYEMRDYPDKVFEDDLTRIEENYRKAIDDLKNGDMVLVGVDQLNTGRTQPFVYMVNSDKSRWEEQ